LQFSSGVSPGERFSLRALVFEISRRMMIS
jgi:hypothetical protein